jgi:hypothetical protein
MKNFLAKALIRGRAKGFVVTNSDGREIFILLDPAAPVDGALGTTERKSVPPATLARHPFEVKLLRLQYSPLLSIPCLRNQLV